MGRPFTAPFPFNAAFCFKLNSRGLSRLRNGRKPLEA